MPTKPLIEKARNAAKFTLIFKTLSQCLGGVATILIVRALSEAEYGIYNLLYSLMSLAGIVASLGISNTLQRYIPEYYHKKEFIIAHNLFRTATFLRILTNMLMLGGILVLWEEMAPLLKLDQYKTYFMLFTLIIFLEMQRRILDICLTSYFLQKYAKSIACLFPLVKIIGYSYVIFNGKSIWYAIVTDLAAFAIVVTGLQILYFKKIPRSYGRLSRFDSGEKKRIFRYAMFYNLNDAGDGLLNSNFDNFFIMIFLTPIAVGGYSFCITIRNILGNLLPLKYFKDVIRPAFFSAGTADTFNQTSLFFQQIIKINSIFTVPCFFFLLLFARDIILVFFNGKFIDFAPMLSAVFFFSGVLAMPAGLVAQLKEKAGILFFSKIFAIYNLVADIILIKYLGVWGAVLATGTAILGKNLFIWYFVRKDASFKGIGNFAARLTLFWGAVSVLLAMINTIMVSSSVARLALGLCCFLPAFLIQFRLSLFSEHEKYAWQKVSSGAPKLDYLLRKLNMIPNGIDNDAGSKNDSMRDQP